MVGEVASETDRVAWEPVIPNRVGMSVQMMKLCLEDDTREDIVSEGPR